MATKYKGCSNYSEAGIRASSMLLSHASAMIKFGPLDLPKNSTILDRVSNLCRTDELFARANGVTGFFLI